MKNLYCIMRLISRCVCVMFWHRCAVKTYRCFVYIIFIQLSILYYRDKLIDELISKCTVRHDGDPHNCSRQCVMYNSVRLSSSLRLSGSGCGSVVGPGALLRQMGIMTSHSHIQNVPLVGIFCLTLNITALMTYSRDKILWSSNISFLDSCFSKYHQGHVYFNTKVIEQVGW